MAKVNILSSKGEVSRSKECETELWEFESVEFFFAFMIQKEKKLSIRAFF